MNLGMFSSTDDSFIFNSPLTPSAWSNYLFNDSYYLTVDQHLQARGFTLHPHKEACCRGWRYFYIKDMESGNCFTPTGYPLTTGADRYECRHSLSGTVVDSEYDDLACRVEVGLAVDDPVELWRVNLANGGTRVRRLTVFAAFPFPAGELYFQGTSCDLSRGLIVRRRYPYDKSDYDRNAPAAQNYVTSFFFTNRTPDSYDCSEQAFFGTPNHMVIPRAVQNGQCSNSDEDRRDSIAAVAHHIELAPGAAVSIDYGYGAAAFPGEIDSIRARYADARSISASYEQSRNAWAAMTGCYTVLTPDGQLDAYINSWLKKQVVFMGRNRRASKSFPVRNLLQDSMGYATLDPEHALSEVLSTVSFQNADGFLHQWLISGDDRHEYQESPGREKHFMDAGIWLVIAATYVLRQTGDLSILDHEYGFRDSDKRATLYEHLLLAVEYLYSQRGERGLVLLREGDWFDPLNGPGRKGRGESTWLTVALVYAGQCLQYLAQQRSDGATVSRMEEVIADLSAKVKDRCWDGNWFNAGYTDDGEPFGTHRDREGCIYLNPQSWSFLTGIADEAQIEKMRASIAKHLETPFGTRILGPAYLDWNHTVGRISVKTPGATENGSVYCHGSAFLALGCCCIQQGTRAFEELVRILPTNPANPPKKNKQIPLYIPNYYFAKPDSHNTGESSQRLETGTVSWVLITVLEYLFGLSVHPDHLEIKPCIPAHWGSCSLRRKIRGKWFTLRIENPEHVESGVREITVNGTILSGHRLELSAVADVQDTEIRVLLGR